jgi:formylglycine-generating enzyme required for sulfatase activity
MTGKTIRIPPEAECEYAARSGGKREKYSRGNDPDAVGWYRSNSGLKTHPVGQKSPNGLGIYDMSGNVWEWCEDVYNANAYSKHSRNNPIYTGSGSYRVLRGGSWCSESRDIRAANRYNNLPDNSYNAMGFRLLFEVR